MNYAHITVESGNVTCKDIEHEFNVWAESMQINWKFFAKPVSATEFRTRFPNAKSIDELAHFGKLFMKTVPGAIIRLVKWNGDIAPISYMEEAWFRVTGIPMKYRCKSTAYYVASMVGKPLALDKNYLRNFSYIRVKIGCQDITLVPERRIGEIRKAFYEFHFTREMPEPVAQPNNQIGVVNENQGEGEHGTPKRQRLLNSDIGSHSAPPRVPGDLNSNHGRQHSGDYVAADDRRRLLGENVISENISPRVSESNTATVPSSIDNCNPCPTLLPVHREVVDALAANAPSGSSTPSTPAEDLYFTKFVQKLAKSGSDKGLFIQKQYAQLMEPIAENEEAEQENSEGERVDLEGSDSEEDSTNQSSEGSGQQYVMGVLALAAPSLENERTAVVIPIEGPPVDVDMSQEGLGSQVIDEMETNVPVIMPRDQTQRMPSRNSTRLATQTNINDRVEDRAISLASTRNLSGTNLNSENSFAVLDNDNIYSRVLEIGVDPNTFHLDNIDCMKDLEIARHSINQKLAENVVTHVAEKPQSPLLLGFGEDESDNDDFTPVMSKRTKKRIRSAVKISLKNQQKRESAKSGGAQDKSCAASVKAHRYHPESDIVAGSRVRKRNPKYL
jgi:hypothetical protein